MINKSLSVLAGGLFFLVAALLAVVFATWWVLPFVVSIAWLGCLLLVDALTGPRPHATVSQSAQPPGRGHDGAQPEADPNRRLAA